MNTNDVTRQVAQAVKDRVEAAGETQLHLAEVTGIPRTTLMRRLSGSSPFTVDELARISEALHCDLVDLVPAKAAA